MRSELPQMRGYRGQGGIVDIEFVVQFLVLDPGEYPSLICRLLEQKQLISSAEASNMPYD